MPDIRPISGGNGPGWTLEGDKIDYTVWAPQPNVIRDEERFPGMWSPDGIGWRGGDAEPRTDWTVNVNPHGLSIFAHHAHEHGDSAEQAIDAADFPYEIREQFMDAIGG